MHEWEVGRVQQVGSRLLEVWESGAEHVRSWLIGISVEWDALMQLDAVLCWHTQVDLESEPHPTFDAIFRVMPLRGNVSADGEAL